MALARPWDACPHPPSRFRSGSDVRHRASYPHRAGVAFVTPSIFDEGKNRTVSAFVPTTTEPGSLSAGGDTVVVKVLRGGGGRSPTALNATWATPVRSVLSK